MRHAMAKVEPLLLHAPMEKKAFKQIWDPKIAEMKTTAAKLDQQIKDLEYIGY